jgi:hypothetical protein
MITPPIESTAVLETTLEPALLAEPGLCGQMSAAIGLRAGTGWRIDRNRGLLDSSCQVRAEAWV